MKYFYSSLVVLILLLHSCNPCDKVVCLNDGSCNDGNCECPDAYEGSDCATHKTPNLLRFLTVKVTNIPPLNPNNDTWDEDGSSADIVVAISGTNGSNDWLSHVSKTQENVTNTNSADLGKPISIINSYFQNLHTIGVYDKDEGTGVESLQLICSYDWDIISMAAATDYTSQLVFSEPGCPEIQLEVVYGYPN